MIILIVLSYLCGLRAGVQLDLAVGALESGGAVAHVAAAAVAGAGRGGWGAPAAVGAGPLLAVGGHGAAVCAEEEVLLQSSPLTVTPATVTHYGEDCFQ